MGLYITLNDGTLEIVTIRELILNKKINKDYIKNISHLSAIDECLKYIKRQYKIQDGKLNYTYSIPMIEYHNVMCWYGDIAKTIFANLETI